MITDDPNLLEAVRERFQNVGNCPISGNRIFFENAGGALTLKSVVEASNEFAAFPDNQGRKNMSSEYAVGKIEEGKNNIRLLFNARSGVVFLGESGTELIFRIIRDAIISTETGGNVVGSTLEHPATRSAAIRWAKVLNKNYVSIPHNDVTGSVDVKDYEKFINKDTRVATIIHSSPVTGMTSDVAEISESIRQISPNCFIIVDGIQHASHGIIDVNAYNIDAYIISPYKVFSRHGYGIGWLSERLSKVDHDHLIDGPTDTWELGTRDAGAYATFSEVVNYFDWLGLQHSSENEPRERIKVAYSAIKKHEKKLIDLMIKGTDEVVGLKDLPGINAIGGFENEKRAGLISIYSNNVDSAEIVDQLRLKGIRVHIRKDDHYSGTILRPLELESCVRVSICHYNSKEEVLKFLSVMKEICS